MSGFREMRRKRQQLSEEESIGILQKATSGTLALLGDGGYPYAVPISYVYHERKLYFHSALAGHKVDAIRKCDKASFCVIEKDDVQPEKYTTFFRSVIAFGRIQASLTLLSLLHHFSEFHISIFNGCKDTNKRAKYQIIFEYFRA